MHRKRMNGRSGPGIVSAKFPRLLTSIGRRGFASKALDYSPEASFEKHRPAGMTLLAHGLVKY